jgi:hypothetical protein
LKIHDPRHHNVDVRIMPPITTSPPKIHPRMVDPYANDTAEAAKSLAEIR